MDFPGSLVVRTSPSSAGGERVIPGQGAKVTPAFGKNNNCNNKNQTEAICNKVNKDLKTDPHQITNTYIYTYIK